MGKTEQDNLWLASKGDLSIKMPQEHTVSVGGIKTHYLESSANKDRHLLFIHGLGSSGDRWLDIPLALSSHFHTIAIDLPGFGATDKPAPGGKMKYTIQDFAGFIAQFMQKIGVDKGNTALVAHSLGGYIALEVAVHHKELVSNLVLVDTSGMLDGPTPLLKEYLLAAQNPTRQTVRHVFEQMVAVPIRIPDILVDGFIYRMGLPGAKEAFTAAYHNSVNTRIGKERLEQIRNRTLVIWGLQDKLIPFEPYCNIFRQSIKSSRQVIIEDAGHAPFAEKPAVFAELLRQFLD